MNDALIWEPESITKLRARIPAALEKVWDYSDLRAGETPSERPGQERTHVLDCPVTTPEIEIGIRTILSRERIGLQHGGTGLFIHASCSARALPSGSGLFLDPYAALQHVHSLIQRDMTVHHHFSHGPVVHIVCEVRE